MLTIGTDPALSLSERSDAFLRAFQSLRTAARAQVADTLGDDLDHATFTGEAAAAVAELVRTSGGHRIVVDPDLYASALDDDEGLVVLAGGDDDVNPPSVAGPSKLDERHETTPESTTPFTYADEVQELRGKALDQALADAGLSTSGKVADKRARLINHNETAG